MAEADSVTLPALSAEGREQSTHTGDKPIRATRPPLSVWLKYGLLVLGAVIMVAPFADMLIGSLRTIPERLARPPVYWPRHPQWQIFISVFRELPMLRWILNSLFVTAAITISQLVTSSMAGYALAKFKFKGRDLILRSVLGAQMFPFFLFLIPMFFILRLWPLAGGNNLAGQGGTGLLNSYAALILPFAVSWYGIFMMRQFMLSIPDELLDAARVDGAGEFRIFSTLHCRLQKQHWRRWAFLPSFTSGTKCSGQ